MRNNLIGLVFILIGMSVFIIQYLHVPKEQVYVYSPGADEKVKHEIIQISENQLKVDGCIIPHTTITTEVFEAEAKKWREEANFSSDGVTGGVIVELKPHIDLKDIKPCND